MVVCSSQGGWGAEEEAGLLVVVELRRGMVGTGCLLSHCPLPEAVIGCGQGYAASAWFQSDHPGKQVLQTEGQGFLCGSIYESGLMSHLPDTDWQAVGLKFN